MIFTVPSAILLAALALPIIAFYILKVRMRRIPVSTNLFWKQIFEEKPPRSIWQNFRHLMSLLMQLFLLTSLVLAFADPYLPWQILQARRIVLVIDPSASMQATDVAPSRFEVAKRDAKAIIEGLRYRDEMAIVLSGATPEVVMGMTSHTPTLIRAVQDISVTDNPTSLDGAIELGKQLIGNHPHGQVIVLTDACDSNRGALKQSEPLKLVEGVGSQLSPRGQVPSEQSDDKVVDVQYRVVATEAANVGIHQFQVRRSLIDPLGYEVLVGVFNASDQPAKCRLELTLDEAIVDVVPLDLMANEKWSRSIEKTSIKGGRLHAQLTKISSSGGAAGETSDSASNPSSLTDSRNLLTRDDDAWAILPARETQKVFIVSPGNLFLTKVFEANPLVEVSAVKELPSEFPSDSLIVLHQAMPERLPSGNVFVVDPTGDCNLWSVGGAVENPIVTEIDKVSPLMHHVRLDNVVMTKANQIQFKNKAKTLAGTIDKFPVYAEATKESGKCLVLSVNLDESDLAFRTVFPIIVSNALGWFAGTSGELMEAQRTGSAMDVRVSLKKQNKPNSTSGARLALLSPSGSKRALASRPTASPPIASELKDIPKAASALPPENMKNDVEDGRVSTGPMSEAGVWRVVASSDESVNGVAANGREGGIKDEDQDVLSEIAVNVADPVETDLRPDPIHLGKNSESVLAAGWFSRPLWFYLVALACILVTAEWFLYQRRIIT